jgi:hypothetical protein
MVGAGLRHLVGEVGRGFGCRLNRLPNDTRKIDPQVGGALPKTRVLGIAADQVLEGRAQGYRGILRNSKF